LPPALENGASKRHYFSYSQQKNGLWAAAQEVGAAGFLEKPYDPEELMALIERTLAESVNAA